MFRDLKSHFKKIYWTKYFKRHCMEYGSRMKVMGPVVITGGGDISCGDDLLIRTDWFGPVQVHVASNANLIMGDKVFLNNRVHISCSSKIRIGTHCDIADECIIIDNDYHDVGNAPAKQAPIIIEDNVWLASRVIVLKGVTIGEGSVIGAGSVVTKSIPPRSFAAGVPAELIRSLD